MDGADVATHQDGFHMAYDVFWDECQSIHSEHKHSKSLDNDSRVKENETDPEIDDLEWLSDIGFTCVLMKYKHDDEIDPDDDEIQSMTATLTRRQSETVRKRIRSLNETLKRKRKDTSSSRHPDVREIFPVQSKGEATNDMLETKRDVENIHSGLNDIYKGASRIRPDGSPTPSVKTPSQIEYQTKYTKSRAEKESTIYDEQNFDSPIGIETKNQNFRMQGDFKFELFYTPESDSLRRGSHLGDNVRPPITRRAKSEGIPKITKNEESDIREDSVSRSKVEKTKSEGSPLRTFAGRSPNTKGITPTKQSHFKSRQEKFADSEEISRIYGVSPKGFEEMKHRSAEDLLKLTLETNNNENNGRSHQPVSKISSLKNGGASIEGDAKLSIGTESPRKENSCDLLFGEAFSPLPNFTLQPEKLGTTRIVDLSEPDMVKVRSLALIELTALFDTCGISMNRRKHFTKLKQKEHGVFGVPLSVLIQRNKKMKAVESHVPKFFKDLLAFLTIHGLREEGLLRIPGSQQRIKAMREEIEEAYSDGGFFSWQERRINDVATLLKQFLRELPTPLLTHEYQETFIAVSELKDRKQQLQALNLLVLLLPTVNRDTLQILLEFLLKVIAVENVNKMGLNNVAMIMAPNLFLRPNSRANFNEINKAAATTDVMRMLIKYQNIIWTVPGFMVTQIRYIYEAGSKGRDSKAVKKIIAKRMKNEMSPSSNQKPKCVGSGDELDYGESDYVPIIRVKAPMCHKTCMAVQLTEYMTAADVVARFRSKRKNSVKEYSGSDSLNIRSPTTRCRSDSNLDRDEDETFCLYECGGNIGERCLDPSTNIAALLKVNPNAELILRCKEIS